MAEIQGRAAFGQEGVGHLPQAHVRTVGRVDAQHVGAQGPEEPGAHRAGDDPGEVQDPDARRRQISSASLPGPGAFPPNVPDEWFARRRRGPGGGLAIRRRCARRRPRRRRRRCAIRAPRSAPPPWRPRARPGRPARSGRRAGPVCARGSWRACGSSRPQSARTSSTARIRHPPAGPTGGSTARCARPRRRGCDRVAPPARRRRRPRRATPPPAAPDPPTPPPGPRPGTARGDSPGSPST